MNSVIEIEGKEKITLRSRDLMKCSLLPELVKIIENLDYKLYVHNSSWGSVPKDAFTIIITSHANNVEYFKQSIGSVIRQTNQNFELILIDHGCEPELRSFIAECFEKDSRIKLLVFHENLYNPRIVNFLNERLFNILNAAICCSEGGYFFFLSYDDFLSDNYVEKMTKLFFQNDKCVVAAPNIASVNEFSQINEEFTFKLRQGKPAKGYANGLELANSLINGVGVFGPPGSLYCFRTEVVLQNGGLDCTNDTSQLLKHAIIGEVGTDHDACLYWRHHPKQTNKQNTKIGGLYYGVYSGWLNHMQEFLNEKKIEKSYQDDFKLYMNQLIHENTLHSIRQSVHSGFSSAIIILKSIVAEAPLIYLWYFFVIFCKKTPWLVYSALPIELRQIYGNFKIVVSRRE